MGSQNYKEPNLMQYYFEKKSDIYKIMQEIRKGCLIGNMPKFDPHLIKSAKKQVDYTRAAIDKSTYQFAQDLNYYIFGGLKRKRVVLFVEGTFYGNENIESVIGIDLGNNPYQLFAKQNSSETIDKHITDTKTKEFLTEHKEGLLEKQLRYFEIKSSRFFYFDEEDLSKFFKDEDLDMVALTPLVIETKGFVADNAVKVPVKTYYQEHSPKFISYRLKTSLQQKLNRKLAKNEIDENDIISDWVAHRILVANEGEARDVHSFLKKSPTIGQSNIGYVRTKNDYYASKKDSKYSSLHIILEVITHGHQPCIREIQVVDRISYYFHEFDNESSAHHSKYKKKQGQSKKCKEVARQYGKILEQIFGRRGILIPI